MTNKDIDQAKEWAKESVYFDDSSGFASAVRVIQSLPDQFIDAEKVRELLHWREVVEQTPIKSTEAHLIAWLHALLTPPLPTLADMTPEEREACQWMQAELDGDPEMRVVIASILPAGVHVLFKDGWISSRPGSSITPLPDLPRLEWPGGGVEDAPIVDGEPTMPLPEVAP